MREDEDHGADEPGQELDELAVRNTSEFLYAGRPPVIVRTTHLQGSEEERHLRNGLRRLMREGRIADLRS